MAIDPKQRRTPADTQTEKQMPREINLSTWPRRRHFEIFRHYEDPFFGMTAQLDATALRDLVKGVPDTSFSAAYYYLSLLAANQVESLRYRLRGESVVFHEIVHGGATVPLAGGRFSYSYFDFDLSFTKFQTNVRAAVAAAQSPGQTVDPSFERDDLVYHTVMPWVTFTHVKHARRGGADDSVPMVAFGRCALVGARWVMPVSLEAHHALMDGKHMGEFFQRMEAWFSDPVPIRDDLR